MKKASEIYESNRCGWYDYQPMLDEFGTIAIQVDQSDYQGDSWVFYNNGDKYGYLQFGWGSCSGCDALQSCDSLSEVQELMDELYVSIIWFDTKTDALSFFENHDWKGDWSSGNDQEQFVSQVKEYLKNE